MNFKFKSWMWILVIIGLVVAIYSGGFLGALIPTSLTFTDNFDDWSNMVSKTSQILMVNDLNIGNGDIVFGSGMILTNFLTQEENYVGHFFSSFSVSKINSITYSYKAYKGVSGSSTITLQFYDGSVWSSPIIISSTSGAGGTSGATTLPLNYVFNNPPTEVKYKLSFTQSPFGVNIKQGVSIVAFSYNTLTESCPVTFRTNAVNNIYGFGTKVAVDLNGDGVLDPYFSSGSTGSLGTPNSVIGKTPDGRDVYKNFANKIAIYEPTAGSGVYFTFENIDSVIPNSKSPTEPYTSNFQEVYSPTGTQCPDLNKPGGSYCTVNSECATDVCTANVCTGTPKYFKISASIVNTGNIDLITNVKDVVSSNSLILTGLNSMISTKNIVQGATTIFESALIESTAIADGTYSFGFNVCSHEVSGNIAEVCKPQSSSVNIVGGNVV